LNNERIAAPVVFLGGVTYDSLTVTSIDRLSENLFILGYLLVLGVMIFAVGRHQQDRLPEGFFRRYSDYFPLVIQFLFGGLLSVYAIFYFRSTPLSVSGIYFLLITGLLVANEFLQNRLLNLRFLLVLYLFVWFSFFVFFVPVILGSMGTFVFLASCLLSLFPVGGLIYCIYRRHFQEYRRDITVQSLLVGGVTTLLIGLYGLNLIPPVPLALQEAGIYHDVRRTDDRFKLTYAQNNWFEQFSLYGDRVPWKTGERVYAYVSVFAPVDLRSTVRHQWQFYVGDEEQWVTTDDLSYEIVGGRRGGYRGTTYKENIRPGSWRINVLTGNDRVLGRVYFTILSTDAEQERQFQTVTRP
jgi:hypothetical protein